jgi:hypothetical protein
MTARTRKRAVQTLESPLHRMRNSFPYSGTEQVTKDPPPEAPVSPMLPPQDGFLFLDKAKFAASYAADVDPEKTAFWADSQVPWGVACFSGAISEPAWRTKPSWYLVATEDNRIPPEAQRAMAIIAVGQTECSSCRKRRTERRVQIFRARTKLAQLDAFILRNGFDKLHRAFEDFWCTLSRCDEHQG